MKQTQFKDMGWFWLTFPLVYNNYNKSLIETGYLGKFEVFQIYYVIYLVTYYALYRMKGLEK